MTVARLVPQWTGSPTKLARLVPAWYSVSVFSPGSDVSVSGWTGTPDNVNLYTNINEAAINDADYISSPGVISGTYSSIFGLTASLAAGTWDVQVRSRKTSGSRDLKVHLLDASSNVLASSGWQALTDTYATYTVPLTISGTATRIRLEVQ